MDQVNYVTQNKWRHAQQGIIKIFVKQELIVYGAQYIHVQVPHTRVPHIIKPFVLQWVAVHGIVQVVVQEQQPHVLQGTKRNVVSLAADVRGVLEPIRRQ